MLGQEAFRGNPGVVARVAPDAAPAPAPAPDVAVLGPAPPPPPDVIDEDPPQAFDTLQPVPSHPDIEPVRAAAEPQDPRESMLRSMRVYRARRALVDAERQREEAEKHNFDASAEHRTEDERETKRQRERAVREVARRTANLSIVASGGRLRPGRRRREPTPSPEQVVPGPGGPAPPPPAPAPAPRRGRSPTRVQPPRKAAQRPPPPSK